MRFAPDLKIGICGGGQLGMLTLQKLIDWGLQVHILDPQKDAVCAPYTSFMTQGSFADFENVVEFGRTLDAVTIEIDSVNADALIFLEKLEVNVFPNGRALKIIQDKGLQKEYFSKNNIPTGRFQLLDDLTNFSDFPAVIKSRSGGYDGHGVRIVQSPSDLQGLFEGPYLIEKKEDILLELSVIAARDDQNNVVVYEPSEMVFHPKKNLLDYLVFPARVEENIAKRAKEIAAECILALGVSGLLAVEFFLTAQGELLVNEVSPRAHNSGHQTIESCDISQYEMLARIMCGLPIHKPVLLRPSVLLNLLGEPGYSGPVHYQGIAPTLKMPGASVHLYGKKETRPLRKMGHVTICGANTDELIAKAGIVRDNLKIISQ